MDQPISTIGGFNSMIFATHRIVVWTLPASLNVHDLPSTAPLPEAVAAPAFDPSLYPRTYRLATGWQIFAQVFSGALILGGLAGLGSLATGYWGLGPLPAFLLTGLCSAVILCGAYAMADAVKSSITLFPDDIEIADMRPTRRMRRADIRRFSPTRSNLDTLLLIPHNPNWKAVKIPSIVTLNTPFHT